MKYRIYPNIEIESNLVEYFLKENRYQKVSEKKYLKMYYNYFRPVIPRKIRFILQSVLNSKKIIKNNFIDEDLVSIINKERIKSIQYKNGFKSAFINTHDVDTQEGFDYIKILLEHESKLNIKSTWFIVPYKYKIDYGLINELRSRGHEIAIHGFNHDGKLFLNEKIFNKRLPKINEALKRFNSIGFRSPMVHRNIELIKKINIKYDASYFDYDPYQPYPGGCGSIWPFNNNGIMELPYTLPQDHTLFIALKKKENKIWKAKSKWLMKNHGTIHLITHPDYLKLKYNLGFYLDFLEYIKKQNLWFATCKDLYEWTTSTMKMGEV